MRIYYFGELIADTNKTTKNTQQQQTAKKNTTLPARAPIIDIITNRPADDQDRRFVIRNFAHA